MTPSIHSALLAHVGTPFTIDGTGGDQTLVLESVDEPRTMNGVTTFGATFRGGPATPAEQGTHVFSADGFAPTPLFIVPAGRDDRGVIFHAAFTFQEA